MINNTNKNEERITRNSETVSASIGPRVYRAKITTIFANPTFTPGTATKAGIKLST